jgi:hypothetical protein
MEAGKLKFESEPLLPILLVTLSPPPLEMPSAAPATKPKLKPSTSTKVLRQAAGTVYLLEEKVFAQFSDAVKDCR